MLDWRKCILLMLGLMISAVALAHEGHDHGSDKDQRLKGTIETIVGSQLTVKSSDGKQLDVHVDEKTRFDNAGTPGKLEDLKIGAKVVVHGQRMKDGALHAKEVRYRGTKAK